MNQVVMLCFVLMILQCSLSDIIDTSPGSIGGSTAIDNPGTAEVPDDPLVGRELGLYPGNTPQERFDVATVEADGSFLFTHVPLGNYDIFAMDSTGGTLYRSIVLSKKAPDYTIVALPFYPVTEGVLSVQDSSVKEVYLYDHPFTPVDSLQFAYRVLDIVSASRIEDRQEIQMVTPSGVQRVPFKGSAIITTPKVPETVSEDNPEQNPDHCPLLKAVQKDSTVAISSLFQSDPGNVYLHVIPTDTVVYGTLISVKKDSTSFGYSIVRQKDETQDSGIAYSFDYLVNGEEQFFSYTEVCCLEDALYKTEGALIAGADTTAVAFIEPTKEVLGALGFDCPELLEF
ncbi:MAG: hypothetical protein OCC49_10250 [Fibrobacterales bacterium]